MRNVPKYSVFQAPVEAIDRLGVRTLCGREDRSFAMCILFAPRRQELRLLSAPKGGATSPGGKS